MRHFFLIAATGALLSWSGQLAAAVSDEIITEATAQRYGLTRMWVTQAQVNRGQGRLQAVVLCDGALYAQSSRATLEAIDAETGQKLWAKMVGQPNHPSLPPSACRDLVATINGSTLFVLNRYTGDILYQTTVNGAPRRRPCAEQQAGLCADGRRHDPRLSPGAGRGPGQGTRQARSPRSGNVGR